MITVDIPGQAIPQGSARAFVVKGRAVVTSANKGLAAWRSHAVRCIHARLLEEEDWHPLAGPVGLSLTEYRVRPKGRAKKHRWPDTRPDCDKIIRAAGDALEAAGAFTSDAQVCRIHAEKQYGETAHLVLVVYSLEE